MQAHDDVSENARGNASQDVAAPVRERATRDNIVSQIEEMFAAAQAPPVHSKNPSLIPVEVMPVLPDMDCWTHDYATTMCDSEMITHVDYPRMGKLQRQFMKDHALLKPYSYPDRDTTLEFIAHLVPQDVPSEADIASTSNGLAAYPEPVEGDYDWSREFSYRKDKSTEGGAATYAIMLQGKQATYVRVNNAFVLGKRRRKDMMAVPVPERITVKMRESSAAEAAQHRSKMNLLYGVDDDQVEDTGRLDNADGNTGSAGARGVEQQDDLFSDAEEDD